MKVILLQHVKGKGQKGDIIEVSDGYAQNALIPRGLAKIATNAVLNKVQQAKAAAAKKAAKQESEIRKVLSAIDGQKVTIKEKVNEKGGLYHALGTKEIIRAIYDQLKLSTPNNLYAKNYALKEVGAHKINLSAYGQSATITVHIEAK
jgi:large subunit ribosomal protein L9